MHIPKPCQVDSAFIWCWIDEQSERISREKAQFVSDSVVSRLHAEQRLLNEFCNWLREIEIESELENNLLDPT